MMTITRTTRTIRNVCLATLVAAGSFWVVMLNSPPKTEAAAPQVTQFSPMALPIPANLPIGVYDAI